jgi:hypothetical protein
MHTRGRAEIVLLTVQDQTATLCGRAIQTGRTAPTRKPMTLSELTRLSAPQPFSRVPLSIAQG